MNHIDTMKLALEAMGLIGADLVCEAAHHEKADRHGIGEPCPIQARWHHAFTALREALAEQPAQKCSYPYCGCNSKAWCKVERNEALDKMAENAKELGLDYEPAQPEPKFFTHCVDQPCDWSEWVCPEPKSYLMKCCDCGLVHEAEFGVVRYKSDTDREDCDFVNDPNLQAVFRMRRSEQWSPADTAHRAGGLTMEQPAQQQDADHEFKNFHRTMCERFGYTHDERDWKRDQVSLIEWIAKKVEQPAPLQEPVVWMYVNKSTHETKFQKHMRDFVDHSLWSEVPLYGEPLANHELQCVCGAVWCGDEMVHLPDKHPQAQRKPLTDEEIKELYGDDDNFRMTKKCVVAFARAIEAAHGIKENT